MKQALILLFLAAHSVIAAGLLDLMKEPELDPKASEHVYRVTILPTFHHPFCVRLVIQPDGSGVAFVKRLSGEGGYDWGTLDFEERRVCSARDVSVFLRRVRASEFWAMPATIERQGVDGTTYTLEAVHDGERHIVERWSPKNGDPFDRLCKQILATAGASEIDAYLPRPQKRATKSTPAGTPK